MSGAVKSGLIFGGIGVIGVLALSFIPFIGALCCGPLTAGAIGTAAGYYGVRWGNGNEGIGRGVLAGTLAGVGTLIGGGLFWLISFSIIQANPELYRQAMQQILGAQTNTELNPAELEAMMRVIGPITALCFGLLNMLLALALSVLGGWMAARGQARPQHPAPMEPPPMAPID